jgi:hypothetical protein
MKQVQAGQFVIAMLAAALLAGCGGGCRKVGMSRGKS